jgi:hypothetical protein
MQPPNASSVSSTASSSSPQDLAVEIDEATLAVARTTSCLLDDDFGSSDEVKVFKDEGEDEEKEFASHEELQAALSEDKSSLIQETEFNIKQEVLRLHDHGSHTVSSNSASGNNGE